MRIPIIDNLTHIQQVQKIQIYIQYCHNYPMPNYPNSISLFLYYVLLPMLLLVPVWGSITKLVVNVNDSSINSISTHSWQITYNTSASRTKFVLNFPTCVTLASDTLVYNSLNVLQTITAFNTTSINFTLSTPTSANSVYTFVIQNVRNCFYSDGLRTYTVWNDIDNTIGGNNLAYVLYTSGLISGCNLQYPGKTGDTNSILAMPLKIKNTVSGTGFRLQLRYPIYFSSSDTLTTNIAVAPTCALSINGTMQSLTNVTSTFTNTSVTCTFSTSNMAINAQPTSYDTIILYINGINNPITYSRYVSNTDYVITTFDTNTRRYDVSSICQPTAIPISQYTAKFSYNQYINAKMLSVKMITNQPIPIRFNNNDQILISYRSGTFASCSAQFLIYKGSNSPSTCTQQTSNTLQTLLYQSDSDLSIQVTDILTLQFTNCQYTMPVSATPYTISLTFSGTNTANIVYDTYMKINLFVYPQPTILQKSQVNLTLSMKTIGDISTYTFDILIKQALSQMPRIIIDFPVDINIGYISSCDVSVNNSGIGSRSCGVLAQSVAYPNSVEVNITSLVAISVNSKLTISLHNITNPSSPTTAITGFVITTYYTSQISDSKVQTGNSIIDPLIFNARLVYPVIVPNTGIGIFRVYTANTQILIQYTVGVKIPAGSITTLTFTTVLQSLVYNSVSANTSLSTPIIKSSNNATVYIFTLPQLQPNTMLTFSYTCLTPLSTGTYTIVNIITSYNNIPYQKTSPDITLTITQPHINAFYINPTLSVTGQLTSYTISFNSNVPYTSQFIIQIILPVGTNLVNGVSACSSGCAGNTTLVDTSYGSTDRIQLTMAAITAPLYSYSFVLTNIYNQRQVTSSPNFIFTTYTLNSRLKILAGTGTTTITTPNLLVPTLVLSDDYYRSNTNPVHISVNLKNRLQYGDYIQFIFYTDTYKQNGTITVAQGTCTIVAGVPLVIKFYPSSTQVATNTISIQIQGLISASDSTYGLSYTIGVTSYSSLNNRIDKGTMLYTIGCGSSASIIAKQCKTCSLSSGNLICTSCYPQLNLLNNTCINNCGTLSKYQTYNNSNICVNCVTPCYYCNDATNCIQCIKQYYFIDGTTTCVSKCNTSSGYYIYNITYNNITFMRCRTCTDVNCISCPNNICQACAGTMVLLNGVCSGGCIDGMYSLSGKCYNCDTSCKTCTTGSNTDCKQCNTAGGYTNVSGICTNICPSGTVNLTSGCGCDPVCSTCTGIATRCLSCSNINQYLYKNSCYDTCPTATYPLGKQCIDCRSGCKRCTNTTCMQCSDNYNIYENICYSNCKVIGQRFTSMYVDNVYKCVECPNGCSQCQANYTCTKCLSQYLLNGTVCIRACLLTDTCDIEVKIQSVVPLPGLITFGIYCVIVVLAKIFVIKGMYVPYALLFGGAIVEFVLLAAALGVTDIKLNNITTTTTARLLQTTTTQVPTYLLTTLGLLACSLALNYVLNALFMILFCKYYRSMLLQRQIDIISNYVTLTFGMLTSYRFYLLSFSRFFRQPYIQISQPQKLKPLHIILGISYILDILTMVAGFVLVTNATKLSILYMLGIDLILVIFILWIVFIYVLVKPKNDQYFTQTKKYFFQEQYATQENTMQNGEKINQKQISKAKLTNLTNQKLFVQDYNGQHNIDNLPTLQPSALKVVPKQTQKIQQFQQVDPRTKRKQKGIANTFSSQKKFFKSGAKQQQSNNQTLQKGVYQTIQKTQADNRRKISDNKASYRSQTQFQNLSNDPHEQNIMNQKNKNKVKTHERNQSESVIKKQRKISQRKIQDQIYDFQEDNDKQSKKQSQIIYEDDNPNLENYKKQKKYKPQNQRSATIKVGTQSVSAMKKKKVYGNLQSQAAESNLDEVDLQSIIQSKMIDRSKQKQKANKGQLQKAQTQVGKDDETNHYEEISPSWFNIQNQRYDIDDKSLQ